MHKTSCNIIYNDTGGAVNFKKVFKYIVLAALPSAMIACGGSSGNGGNNTGGLSLTVSAPNQLPTGLSVESYQAFLTLNNTSNESATNLDFSIPDELNTAGSGSVTVSNTSSGNNCKNIPAMVAVAFP